MVESDGNEQPIGQALLHHDNRGEGGEVPGDPHGHSGQDRDDNWDEEGGGGEGEGSKEHAHRMIANIYPSK